MSRRKEPVIPADLLDQLLTSTEIAGHRQLAHSTGVKAYFAAPNSPRQPGSNENANGLIRLPP